VVAPELCSPQAIHRRNALVGERAPLREAVKLAADLHVLVENCDGVGDPVNLNGRPVDDDAVAPFGAAEVGAAEVGAAEVGAAEVGAAEVGAAEVGAAEVGAAEVGRTLRSASASAAFRTASPSLMLNGASSLASISAVKTTAPVQRCLISNFIWLSRIGSSAPVSMPNYAHDLTHTSTPLRKIMRNVIIPDHEQETFRRTRNHAAVYPDPAGHA